MAYTPVSWTETTELSAVNLNVMDDGIADHDGATGDSAHDNMGRIATGTYTGNGNSFRTISTPFEPNWVTITARDADGFSGGVAVVLHLTGVGARRIPADTTSFESVYVTSARVVSGGFQVAGTFSGNTDGLTFDWVAHA